MSSELTLWSQGPWAAIVDLFHETACQCEHCMDLRISALQMLSLLPGTRTSLDEILGYALCVSAVDYTGSVSRGRPSASPT